MDFFKLIADSNKISAGGNNIPALDAGTVFSAALNVIYVAAGITCVITIIIAGYLYTISGGNPTEIERSKNAILYAIIGLIVAGSAFVLTNYVIGRF